MYCYRVKFLTPFNKSKIKEDFRIYTEKKSQKKIFIEKTY